MSHSAGQHLARQQQRYCQASTSCPQPAATLSRYRLASHLSSARHSWAPAVTRHRCTRSSLQQTRAQLQDLFRSATKGSKASKAVAELLAAIEGTERGARVSADQRRRIDAAVEELVELGKGMRTTNRQLSATWKLLWTTEKETLFLVKNAGWFGTKAGDVYQAIDIEKGTLQNVVTFPPDGAFVVDSSAEPVNDKRVRFKFGAARLQLPKRTLNVPPYGQGWFESVYLDDKIRVAKDIRGDTLVVARDGPCRRS